MMPITPAPARPLLTPDQVLVAGAPGVYVEMLCLRQEIFALSQVAVVQSVNGASVEIKPGEVQMSPQLCDIGHVRLSVKSTRDLALTLLWHLIKNEGAGVEEVVGELRAKVGEG